MGHDYGRLPLAFAMLLIVPAGLLTAARHFPFTRKPLRPLWPVLLPAALAAAVSLGLPGGWAAGALMMPWVLVCGWVAGVGGWGLWRECVSLKSISPHLSSIPPAPAIALGAGFLHLLIAGLAAFADRIGYHPFGFGDDIIRLTALHFHFAGFALPVLAGATVIFSKDHFSRFTAWCIVLGVPLTAVGIMATQVHWGPFLEIFAAAFMAGAGLLAGVVWALLGLRRRNGWLLAAGIALGSSMTLALAYALRAIAPDFALSLDQMRAIHGTLNGFLAVPLALIGLWRLGFE